MLRYVVPIILVLSSANSWRNWAPTHKLPHHNVQVASETQVKFALESKYDDTGPGAKQPEYAYNTYNNLEDALIGYLNDPDTKLPEHEKEKAINRLTQQDHSTTHYAGLSLNKKPHFQYQNIHSDIYNYPIGKHFQAQDSKVDTIGFKGLEGNGVLGSLQFEKKLEPFKFQKIRVVKGNPLNLAHYLREGDLKQTYDQFDPHPKYVFSYGVHDKSTGDLKTAQESRDGGNVNGFYSFIDSDGKTRTVHYTASDLQGFQARVHKA